MRETAWTPNLENINYDIQLIIWASHIVKFSVSYFNSSFFPCLMRLDHSTTLRNSSEKMQEAESCVLNSLIFKSFNDAGLTA